MNLTLLILAGAIASGASSAVEADLSAVESRVEALADQAQRLEQAGNVTYLTHDEAVIRFQDNLFLELVGDHGPAAEGFYALVTTHALDDDLGLSRDADWYLAESLAGLGNTKTAAARFQIIVDNPSHPYHDDAVRRLLELYAQTGDRVAFKALYDAEIATGRVTPTPLITYSLAKSFYQQGDFVNARQSFNQVAADTAWYGRARYFLGVMNVVDGHLEDAAAQFQAVADLPVASTEDRLVHDQALLALGRLHYDRGEYLPAAESYALIAEDSPYQADKLYEVVWTSIRAQRWQDALNNVEVFLLAFPDHAYAAQLDLLQGHLNFQQQNWDEAQTSYEQVITDYTPVRDRFAMLAQPGAESDAAVREVLESTSGIEDIPPYALAMMREDPDLSSAMDVFSDLERQRQDIEVSERLITELSAIVNAGEAGTVERVRADALAARLDVVRAKLALIAVEADLELGPNDAHARLTERRLALEDRSNKVTIEMLTATHEVEAVWSESGVVTGELRALRPGRESDETLARMDAAHQSLDETWRRLTKPIEGIQLTNDQALLVQLRAQFDQEVADVGVERSDYEATIGDARTVALNLTRDGFGRLQAFFADSVLKADMGIVDVFWSEKLEVSDELTRVREEKDAALADLERRFQLIHDKMGESR